MQFVRFVSSRNKAVCSSQCRADRERQAVSLKCFQRAPVENWVKDKKGGTTGSSVDMRMNERESGNRKIVALN